MASVDMVCEAPVAVPAAQAPTARTAFGAKTAATATATTATAAAALLAACGGGSSNSGSDGGVANTSAAAGGAAPVGLGSAVAGNAYPKAETDEDAARFLLQAQFSASDADIAAVRSQGYATWLATQFNLPAAQSGVQWLDSRGYGTINAATHFYDFEYPGDFMIWQQLLKSPDGVRKRLALALSEFFVISLNSIELEWRSHAVARYWDLLVKGTQGNFRTLLEDVTLSAAMGKFLNMSGSQKEDSKGRQPDENYAREVMQLFSVGLYQLNPDGSIKLAADGSKLASYTLADVTGLARVMTGWDLDASQNSGTNVDGRVVGTTSRATRQMVLTASRHSLLEAKFLGATVPASTEGVAALKIALDTLFNHPNVGPFFGKQMIQRLVTSNPSPAYVARVAAVFNNNGDGLRGDLRSVFAAVLLDNEARGPAGLTNATFGKLREPMVRFVQWGRSFGLDSASGSWKIDDQSSTAGRLGQSPLRSASVFNFFRPGYVPPSTALAASGQVAPEFQIVNESSVGAYLNFMEDRIRNGFFTDSPGVSEHTYRDFVRDITASYTSELALVADAPALVKRLNLILCAGQLPAASVTRMVTALNATPLTASANQDARLNRVCAAVLMVLASSEYLIQK